MAYPTFNNGMTAQRPFTRIKKYRTTLNDMPSGMRHSYANRATALWAWEIQYGALAGSEVTTLENFWNTQKGAWGEFEFIDPEDSSSHLKCRFAMDDLEIQYIAQNIHACRVLIAEYS